MPCAASAQVLCALGSGAIAYDPSKDQRASADAIELTTKTYTSAKDVCGQNCPQVAVFRNATAANLMLIAASGVARIVYNPQFFSAVYDRHGDAGIAAVIAHEIGHALDDTLGAAWVEKGWTPELRADGWAGCVLAKNGLPAAGMRAALAALEENPPASRPAWNLRLQAIRAGYTHCGGSEAGFPTAAPRGR